MTARSLSLAARKMAAGIHQLLCSRRRAQQVCVAQNAPGRSQGENMARRRVCRRHREGGRELPAEAASRAALVPVAEEAQALARDQATAALRLLTRPPRALETRVSPLLARAASQTTCWCALSEGVLQRESAGPCDVTRHAARRRRPVHEHLRDVGRALPTAQRGRLRHLRRLADCTGGPLARRHISCS